MLCFEVRKNNEKLAIAGLQESGVLSLILTWVGKDPGASGHAAAAKGPIPGLNFQVGGIDSSNPAGDSSVYWVEEADLRLGDELHIRLCANEAPDAPLRAEPAKPASEMRDGSKLVQCSFCGQMRRFEPAPAISPGVAGADVFMCTRCLVLAERLLDDGLSSLFHLRRDADQTCSFCGTEHGQASATAGSAHMCHACVDMMMKDAE